MFLRSVLVMLGVACGGLATIAFYLLFHSSPPAPVAMAKAELPPPPMVVVAAKAIPTGTLIKLQDLRLAPVAAKQPTAGDYLRTIMPGAPEQAAADRRLFGEIAEAVSRTRFDEGAPIVRDAIVKPGDAGFLAAVLRPGKRAVTVSVNRVTGAAGLLYPGDHVDVVLTQVFPGHDLDPGNRT
ncbi:MAG: Flp pilus assembly protein CpaB, partial [Stellaceae bacterium]